MRWDSKIELAMHTGNCGSPFRKKLAAVAEEHPEEMLVNEVVFAIEPMLARCSGSGG